jgi:iron complex outermembrane receptor protein
MRLKMLPCRSSDFQALGREKILVVSGIKKTGAIGVLLAVNTTVSLPETTVAQSDSTKVGMKLDLDEIEVSAQRAPVAFSQWRGLFP